MKQNRKWTRLTALALALTLFLTGCAGSVDGGSAGNKSLASAPPQTTAPASTPSEEPSAAPTIDPEEEEQLHSRRKTRVNAFFAKKEFDVDQEDEEDQED